MEKQFTVKGINGTSTMNRAAYEEYQNALEIRLTLGRYTLEAAAQFVEKNSNANADSIFEKLKESAKTGELEVFAPGSDEVYKPKAGRHAPDNVVRGWYEEAYWNNLNDWLKKNEPRLDCEFPNPCTSAAAKVEAVNPSITKQQAINAFDGLHFDRKGWNNALSDVPKWIESCRVMRGRKGDKSTSATWNPVLIATALFDKQIPIEKLDAVFVRLNDWAVEWKEISASFRD